MYTYFAVIKILQKKRALESTYQLYGKHPENPNNQLVDTPEHFTRAP